MNDPLTAGPLLTRAKLLTQLIPDAVACHRTAAHVWGVSSMPCGAGEDDWPVELALPIHLDIPGCTTHETPLPASDITTFRDVRVTTPARTALDCARLLPPRDGVAVLDQFLRRGVELDTLLSRATGFTRLRQTLALADRGAASPRESWLRVAFIETGLPRPATQIKVKIDGDRTAYLDLGWPNYRLAVEYDGRVHHSSPADRQRDEIRRTQLRERGWCVLPVRRDVIPARVGDLLEQVANMLIDRGWHPGTARMTHILSRIRAARRHPRLPRPRTPSPSSMLEGHPLPPLRLPPSRTASQHTATRRHALMPVRHARQPTTQPTKAGRADTAADGGGGASACVERACGECRRLRAGSRYGGAKWARTAVLTSRRRRRQAPHRLPAVSDAKQHYVE